MIQHELIYHIASQEDWAAARQEGAYRADSLASEGFIHASTREQVLRTAEKYYRGQPGLVLLEIEASKVNAEVRYEDLAGEGLLFPHIFGPLNLNAVAGWAVFSPQQDGSFGFPERFQAVI